ncbi:MAG: tyrosine-type recombinase/integrase [Pseudomonadota bacterium]
MARKTQKGKPARPKAIEVGPVRASTTDRWRDREGAIEWYWRARRKAERVDFWVGWGTRDAVERRLAGFVVGGIPMPVRQGALRQVNTLGDLLDHWAEQQTERPDLSPHTIDHYRKCARHIVAWLREVDTRRMDRLTVERYRDNRLREGASRRLVLQELRILGMAWRWGQECALVPDRALPRVPLSIEGFVINHRTPTPAEALTVLGHLQGDARIAVHLLAVTGARISEICNLRSCDIDPKTGELALDGKTGLRTFPLPAEVSAALVKRAGVGMEPLLDLGKRDRDQNVRSKLARACKVAGVPPFTPHGLRRMVVDRMARAGVDVATAASLTGHSPEVMLRHYRQVSADDRRRAVALARLGVLVEEAGEKVIQGPWGAGR